MSVARPSRARRPQGDGSLYYDEARDRWVARLDLGRGPDGRRVRRKVSARSKAEAAGKLRALRRQHDEGLDVAARGMTVGELLDRWLADAAPARQSPSTVDTNRRLVTNHLRPRLGALRVRDLRPEHVEDYLRTLAAAGAARSSLVKHRSVLAQALRWAERRRLTSWNPARLADLPPVSATKPPREGRALTVDEARRFLTAARGHRLEAWAVLGLTLGLRPGELGGLTWDALDLPAGLLTVRQALKWHVGVPVLGPTKTGGVRTLALPPEAVEVLERHRLAQARERDALGGWPPEWAGLVFLSSAGTPYQPKNLRRYVADLAKAAGIEGTVGPYSLRHTATTLLSGAGVRAEEVADVLGHVDTRMVLRHYRHRTGPSVRAAVPAGSALLAPVVASHGEQ